MILYLIFALVAFGIVSGLLAIFMCMNNAKSRKYEYRLREKEYKQKHG